MHAQATIGFGFTSDWLKIGARTLNQSLSEVERVSIECRKTKTKVITLANQKDEDNPVNQSTLEVITRSRHKARENVHAQVTIGFGFTSDWSKN